MGNRLMILGMAMIIAIAVAIPALAGSSDVANTSASLGKVAKTANKALKKANKANKGLDALVVPTVLRAVVAADGSLVRGTAGASSSQTGTGLYTVGFGRDLTQCAWVTSIGSGDGTPVPPGETHSSLAPGETSSLLQQISSSAGVLTNRPFHVIVSC